MYFFISGEGSILILYFYNDGWYLTISMWPFIYHITVTIFCQHFLWQSPLFFHWSFLLLQPTVISNAMCTCRKLSKTDFHFNFFFLGALGQAGHVSDKLPVSSLRKCQVNEPFFPIYCLNVSRISGAFSRVQ